MDLKSMLNDSSNQRPTPRLHTSHSSIDYPSKNASQFGTPLERQSPYPQPPYTSEQRTSGVGSYFALQSPHPQNSISTPIGEAHSSYAQSPAPYGQPYTPRGSVPPQNHFHSSNIHSQSPPVAQAPTPGAPQYQHNSSATAAAHRNVGPPGYSDRNSPHDDSILTNGTPQSSSHQISPSSQFHHPPSTPLGPPMTYPKPPPQQFQRPTSQGHEHHRRSSLASVGSSHGQIPSHIPPPDRGSMERIQRSFSGDEERIRERSIESVSPKTIPRAPPRQSSGHYSDTRPEMSSTPHSATSQAGDFHKQITPDRAVESSSYVSTPRAVEQRVASHLSAKPSPGTGMVEILTPKSTHSSLPTQPSPPVHKQPNLKRNASVVSTSSVSALPPRKRLRRDEVPIFAQSARTSKPLRLNRRGPAVRPPPVKKEQQDVGATNGHVRAVSLPPAPQGEPRWEPSILNIVPYEDLTRKVCDWIVRTIGSATPPSGGAVFEIEAKIGAIIDIEYGERLNLPVDTETLFNKDKYRRTKFESTMNMMQHKQLNAFLNGLVQQSFAEAQTSNREVIRFDHPKESDEFFELTQEGRHNLPTSIQQWLNPKHRPRVRRTTDNNTGALKAQIIKSRIADLDIYNPSADFDYRLSISIESPWEGESHWLSEMTDGGRDRNKDRMSYRHMAYQIDLTQVSYTNSSQLEHELEVEISTEQIRLELENLRANRPSKYEDLVRGFIDNVRILCRKGTLERN